MLETLKGCCKRLVRLASDFELTVKRLAVFSCAMGLVTALSALLVPHGCSLYNISEYCELWIVLVLFVAMKSRTEQEAALMSGGMMFCAHFAAAMIKMPFDISAAGEFIGRVPAILCAFPLAFFAKRAFARQGSGRVWFLSVTAGVMIIYDVVHLRAFVNKPVYQLIAVLFCFGSAAVMVYGLVKDRDTRLIPAAVCGVTLTVSAVFCFWHTYRYRCVLLLDSAKYPLTDGWSVSAKDDKISTPELVTDGDNTVLEVTFYEKGENTYTLKDPDGGEYEITVSYDEEKGVNVYDNPA